MAHFAQLNSDNVVVNVLVVADEELFDARFSNNESEAKGVAFLEATFGDEVPTGTYWKQTSYNTINGFHPEDRPLRLNMAHIGWVYDAARDAFYDPVVPKGYSIDADGRAQPPTPPPADGDHYWDEETESWLPQIHPEGYEFEPGATRHEGEWVPG